ncbi:MAG TPA: septation protein A [Sphingomicrobium sp.]|nr:septation protein A [Sphingomicrobium sp.]
MSEAPASPPRKQEPSGGGRLLIDLGPLLVFFIANFFAPVPGPAKVFFATGAFMIAMIAAIIYSQARYRHVSPLLLFSGAMVVILGGLTIWLHNETFIKIKPTVYYLVVAGLLGFGLATKRPLLKSVLGSAYPGLDAEGWRKLTRNWAIFFVVMAAVNEGVWRNSSTNFWIGFKLWGAIPATLLFALANVPMLMKHGLTGDEAKDVSEPAPIE